MNQIPIAGSEMRYVFYFLLKIIVIIAQSGLKSVVAAGVEMNKFVISSHNGAIAIKCLFDRTEGRILSLTIISMHLRNETTEMRNMKIHHQNSEFRYQNCAGNHFQLCVV